MATRHDKTVADYLRNNTAESSVFQGPIPEDAPDELVACRVAGGPQGRGRFDGGQDYIREPRVQVMIRGPRHDAESARDRAHDILSTLDGATPTDYLDLRVTGSAPNELQPDDNGRPLLSINVKLLIDEA